MSRKNVPYSFTNSRGLTLAGHIDMPTEDVRAFGVFVPCFTCPKESMTAARICRELAENDIAMMRFDTTGVGASQGSHASSSFTTRVDDIISASKSLARDYSPPKILIGHSLGGTAGLKAALLIPSLELVATIGSPSDPASVLHGFHQQNRIKYKGHTVVEIDVLGTPYEFEQTFLDDLTAHDDFDAEVAGLKPKLLVFQAPNDAIVPAHNAHKITTRTKGASLVMLADDAGHLLENRDHASLVAQKILTDFSA